MKHKFASIAAASVFAAGAASAGGYVPVVVDPVPVAPIVTPAPVGNWQGGYAGATLGYGFGGEDVVGTSDAATGELIESNLGEFEISGANAGLRAGYRWQRGNLVFGPELSVEGGNVSDEVTLDTGLGALDASFDVNHVLALKLKTGYEVAPNTLVFGTAGVARGDFTYKVGTASRDFTSNGYVFGIGVERKVSDRMSVTGEIERNQFDSKTIEYGGLATEASPSFNNVKVGVNFSF